jgi:hypothetical protein
VGRKIRASDRRRVSQIVAHQAFRLGNQSGFNCSALNGSVFGKLRMDEAGNHRAIHLFGDLCIRAELRSECSDFADDLFHTLRRSHVVGRLLERSRLLDVSATLGQIADDLPVYAVDVRPYLFE